ncbi:MAG: 2-dehydropantoate 2-reductase [Pseudomonadota bacterium]
MENLRWDILGAGAMGTVTAWLLQQQGHRVRLWSQHSKAQIRRLDHGAVDLATMQMRGDSSSQLGHAGRTSEQPKVESFLAEPVESIPTESIARLIVNTKATDCAAALTLIDRALKTNACVVLTSNGMGFEQDLKPYWRDRVFLRTVSTSAAHRPQSDQVVLAAIGQTRFGFSPMLQPQAHDSDLPRCEINSLTALPGWSWHDDIDPQVKRKFCLNCVINPLTGVLRCLNGDLLEEGEGATMLKELATEVEPAARALNLWVGSESLHDAAVSVCRSTAGNRSSTLQDIQAGRPTEIAYLNAELLARAGKQKLDLPLCRRLVDTLERGLF